MQQAIEGIHYVVVIRLQSWWVHFSALCPKLQRNTLSLGKPGAEAIAAVANLLGDVIVSAINFMSSIYLMTIKINVIKPISG